MGQLNEKTQRKKYLSAKRKSSRQKMKIMRAGTVNANKQESSSTSLLLQNYSNLAQNVTSLEITTTDERIRTGIVNANKQEIPSTSSLLQNDYNLAQKVTSLQKITTDESMELNVASSTETSIREINQNMLEIRTENEPHLEKSDNPDTLSAAAISGRRIIDVQYFFKQLFEMGEHEPFSCNITNMEVVSERRIGLCSLFLLKCKNCNITTDIATDDIGNSQCLNINDAAVLSCISTGIGHSQLVEQHAAINLPSLSFHAYNRSNNNISDVITKSAWDSMEVAGKEEAEIARQEGNVDKNGIPTITVIADGAWCKRSYRVNYNASSGVACIIGQRTGKLLYLGIKNKYCTVCARSENKNENPPLHTCFRNWNSTSTSMESEIILEGFKNSVSLHGIIYKRLVGDGDSSVMKKISLAKPYGNNLVEKVECRNHLLRNFINKLRDLANKKTTSTNCVVPINLRKCVAENVKRFRAAVATAISFRKSENKSMEDQVANLKRDLLNAPSHIFGEHKECANLGYFCNKNSPDEDSKIKEIRETGLYNEVLYIIYRLVNNAFSLILDMNNNSAESYNAVVCKYIGGKRVNFSLKRGYQTRCEAAAVSYNSKGEYYDRIYKTATTKSPGQHTKQFIRHKKITRQRYFKRQLYKNKQKKTLKHPIEEADEDYGGTPDLTDQEFEEKKTLFLEKIKKTPEEIKGLEKSTRSQSSSALWKQERAIRLTASTFGRVCKMLPKTSCANIVKTLLYSNFSGNRATEYGKPHEKIALKDFEDQIGLTVSECGLFLHPTYNFLGASPDGMVGNDCILEIKCPASAENLKIEEAINHKKIKFAKIVNGYLKLNENDIYM